MLKGLEIFRRAFEPFTDRYVLIGGAACSVILDRLATAFRVTKDLDIVLCLEKTDPDFGRALWDFIKSGGYEFQETNEGKKSFYRFRNPRQDEYPVQLELFTKRPETLDIPADRHLVSVPMGENVSSLSAILLDREYSDLIYRNRQVVDGLSVGTPESLIALKAKAFIDLQDRKNSGEGSVDSRHIRKHMNDVARLFAVLTEGEPIRFPERIRDDLREFAERIQNEKIDMKSLGIPFKPREFIEKFREVFRLRP